MTEVCFISSLARSCARVPAVWVPTPLCLSFRIPSNLNVSRSARYWVQCSVLVYDVLCCCCCCRYCCCCCCCSTFLEDFRIQCRSQYLSHIRHCMDAHQQSFYFILFFSIREEGWCHWSEQKTRAAPPSNIVTVSMRAQSLERIIQSLAKKKK